MKIKLNFWEILIIIQFIIVIIGFLTTLKLMNTVRTIEYKAPVVIEKVIEKTIEKTEPEEPKETVLLQGKVSYYDNDGCLGCREDRLMANGQVFNENALTLAVGVTWTEDGRAIPEIDLNTKVLVRNLDNGKEVIAMVTDTGGFNNEKYGNRIADLSKGLCGAVECKTNKSSIQIIEIKE